MDDVDDRVETTLFAGTSEMSGVWWSDHARALGEAMWDLWPYYPLGRNRQLGRHKLLNEEDNMATTLARWEPFGIEFPSLWRRWLDTATGPEGWLRVEEIHEDGNLVIRAELPGVDPDKDVDVSVTDHVLHISAKREERKEQKKDKDNYRSEFRYGEFSRDIHLPSGVTQDAVKADYKDGILEVQIPWPAEPERSSTKVPVSRS